MTHPRALLAIASVALAAVVLFVFGRGDAARGETSGLTPGADDAVDRVSAPSVDVPDDDGANAPKVERSALALEPASSEAPAAVEPVGKPGARISGTVIDARSLPIADAEVRLLVSGRPVLTTHSGDDGRFELAGIPPSELPWLVGTLHAVAPDGRAATRVTHVPTPGSTTTRTPIELVVAAARSMPVVVIVEDEQRPIAGAEVELEAGFERALVGVAQTDAEGRVRFDGVPLGSLHARAAVDVDGARHIGDVSVLSAHPDGTPLRIVLGDARDITVFVREKGTGLPRSGVRVYAERTVMPGRTFMRPGDPDAPSERVVAGAVATTDGEGRAVLRGLPRERLLVHAEVKSYGMFDGSPRRRVGADDIEATLEVVSTDVRPRVRWPIVAGDRPVPPSGARIQLRIEPGRAMAGAAADWPREGVMEGSELVVESVPDTHVGFLAATDDGGIARLVAASGSDLGLEASFRRARTITVRVFDHAGAPLTGYVVGATNQGNNELCEPVHTDADGIAVIDGLHGGLADVWVAGEGRPRNGAKIGSIDLEQGDGNFEFTMPEELRATLRVFVDGTPGLPPGLTVPRARVLSKDPAEALVTLAFTFPAEDAAMDVWVNAPGFSSAKVALTRALATPGAPPAEARLERAGALVVDVLRTPETNVRLVAERQQDDGTWSDPLHLEFQFPNADDGRFRLFPLASGRYRARDAASGAATEAVEVDPARADAHVTLDLTRHGMARGVVVGPEGYDLSTARVIVDGVDAPVADTAWRHAPGTPRGSLAVDGRGAFSLAVSLDKPVTLRAWHPVLSAAAEGGTLQLAGPREDITLRLAVGPTCEWTMPATYKARQRVVPRVLVYHDAARARLASEHVAELHDGRARFGGFTPGTYTLWIDVVHDFAPLILPDVVLGEGRTELDAPQFTAGSAVRVVLRPKAGASAPRITMSAFSDERGPDGALYNRQLNSRGEVEVVLAGLGAGSFQLRVGTFDIHELVPPRTITLDGTREELIEVDL